MKTLMKLSAITALIFSVLFATAQAPNGFNYQAVIRDAGNNVLISQSVGIRVTIQQGSIGGTEVYSETFAISTNAFGLVNLNIGSGTTVDDFSTIDWGSGPYYVEIAADVAGGTSYVVVGTSQLLSVPYALHARTADNVVNLPNMLWQESGANISNVNTGNVGIGTSSPANPLSVLQVTGSNNTVRIESQDHPTGKDLLELIVPSGSTAGSQFIEMQNGSDIVAAINSDGSAEFKSIEFEDNTVQTTAAIGPIAYGSISSAGTISSGSGGYTVAWVAANSRYEITITGETYHFTDYTAIVTPATSTVRAVRTSSVSGKFLVYLYDSAGSGMQGNFHFVVYE